LAKWAGTSIATISIECGIRRTKEDIYLVSINKKLFKSMGLSDIGFKE
jgi:hypothetical protein